MNESQVELTAQSAALVQAFFGYGVVLVCFLLCGFGGLRAGLFRSILFFGGLVTAAMAAFAWCDGTGGLLRGVGVPEAWSLVAGYVVVVCAVLGLMGVMFWFLVRSEVMTYAKPIDRLGGLLIGVVAGVFMASVIRVGLAMLPISAAARPVGGKAQVDVTPRVLMLVARIMSSDAETRRAWLQGPQGGGGQAAPGAGQVFVSEPYVDVNENDEHDKAEPFSDKDGDGVFTEKFAAAEPGSSVGVVDRYLLGNWRLVKATGSGRRSKDVAK